MSGPRDRFDVDGELDQLAQDLELDMDAPIGATFAAALRGTEAPQAFEEADFGLDDDGFMTPPPRAVQAPVEKAPIVFSDPQPVSEEPNFDMASFDDEFGEEFAEEAPPPQRAEVMEDLPPPPAAHSEAGDMPAWLQPKPAQPPVEDLPPMTAYEAEPVADDAAGQGLGFDYAFEATPSGGDRIIPRISIHAFCTRTSTLNLMRGITKDRRMKNVAMDVFEGGAGAATQYYVNETTPNLLIIEGSGDPRQLLAELDSLAEYCDENIRVVVVGQTNDIRLYRELMRRGVSEYLVAPIDPVQMIRAIAGLFTDPEAPFTGKTLAVTGVKGGVGASSIANGAASSC